MIYKNKKKTENKENIEIYGVHPVIAALKNNTRIHQKLIITHQNSSLIDQEIKKKVNKISIISKGEMSNVYGGLNVHQGIILITSRLQQPDLEEIIQKSKNNKEEIVVMLDHITDPHNIGSIMRSCALFNCKSIIVSKNNSPDITSSMTKTASGAIEIVNYIKVKNLSRAIDKFKKNNFWVYGLDNNNKLNFNKTDLPKKILLILGSEGKGLRKLTKNKCDGLISIPIKKNSLFKIESLNVSNACSIFLYEYYKKNI